MLNLILDMILQNLLVTQLVFLSMVIETVY